MLLIRNIVLIIILVIVTYTDIKRREIDNEPIILGLCFIVLFSIYGYNDVSVKSSILGFLIGGISFTILAFWGMGGGDIKLMSLIGFFLGWKLTVLTICISFFIGSLMGIFYVAIKNKGLKEYFPFGPSIAMATCVALYYGSQLIENYNYLWYLR